MNAQTGWLFRLDELEEGQGVEFEFEDDGVPASGFAVRHGQQVFAYRNRCPHLGVSLNWMPGQFLDAGASAIQCANHDALFRIEDGFCYQGPCAGRSLVSIPVRVSEGSVYLAF